ncbi:hypothetical protein AVEN_144055-1 [Araneus ventricosus]|uniref:Uncharacterized protein n=1 Tax=Araneus ventricosus TaxID=182803 RepID=A0A4Y2DET3_ARAVE|nr:hypothetical protein AVEN_144055-1 [Araneus ventricosus]
MSGVKRKRNVLKVELKLEILQKLDNGESASTDAEDVLNEENTISHSAALQSVETLLDYMGQRGFDCGSITAVRKMCLNIRQEANCQKKRRKHAANISDHSVKIEPENFPDFLVMRMFSKDLFLSSDPVLTSMRPTMRKKSKSFLKETLEMFRPMESSEVLDEEDSDHEETDNDINDLSSDE